MTEEPIRDREELQRAHDVLFSIMADEDVRRLFIPALVERARWCAETLCWTLRHDHNQVFPEVLTSIEQRMKLAGIEFFRLEEMQYPGGRPKPRPRVVCLCGSTRFHGAFLAASRQETLAGRIVLSVGCFVHLGDAPVTPDEKRALDELHLRKIDMADEILVLNVGGYIGVSTRAEIVYATARGKPIRYLETADKAA